jgi:hypothetical protein
MGCEFFLASSFSIIDFNGAMPVPVAMNKIVLLGFEENVNFPFGPVNSTSSPFFNEFNQLLPRPFGIVFIQSSNEFLFNGGEEIEYARKHGVGELSAIFSVIN